MTALKQENIIMFIDRVNLFVINTSQKTISTYTYKHMHDWKAIYPNVNTIMPG